MPSNFKLIVITNETDIPGEDEKITGLFEAGLQTLHVRKYNLTRLEVINFLSRIPSKFHPGIVLHQHYDLLNKFNLKGVHLSENRRIGSDITQIRNIVSTSFHKLVNITLERANFEYAFLSPVFRSVSKQGHNPSIGSNDLKDFFTNNGGKIKFPIVALGGITDKNILQAKEIGFSGAACIGYIWEASNPVDHFTRLQKIVQG
jgi:thiamine-phosphate pyrophosphorylase